MGEPTVNGHRHGHDARPQAAGYGVATDEGAIAGEEKHTERRHSARGAFRAFASSPRDVDVDGAHGARKVVQVVSDPDS